MRKQLSIILFLALSFSAIGQSFVDTLALNNYIRANIRDRRPEKVSAENIQQALLGITKFLNSGADSNVFSTRNWVSVQGFSKYSDTNSIFGSKAWVTNQSFTRNADTSNMLFGYVRGSFIAGQLPFANGTRSVAGSANLFWDNTNGRLGVGTSSPNAMFHVNGNSTLAGTSTITTVQTNNLTGGGGNLNVTSNNQYFNVQGAVGGTFAITIGNAYSGTATHNWFSVGGSNFSPTSGSGSYAAAYLNPSVNQTGTASGQTRGLYILANVIAATNAFRAIDVANVRANDYGIYQAGAGSRNYFQGSVGIGTSTPNTSAALDISANDKGVLIPRLTSTEATTNISSPANGLMYYNTDSLRLMIRRSGQWRGVRFTDEGGGSASLPAGNNLDILRNRGGTWVAEPDTTTTNGFVNVTGGTLLQYSGGWATAAINDSAILSKKQIDSLLAAGNGRKFLYSTANTTPVNAAVQSIANNTAGQIEISVTVTSGSGSIKIIRRSFGYKKITGTLTLYTPWDLISPVADSGMSTADVNLVNSSGNAAIQVTGIAGSLDWSIELKFVALVNIPV